MTAVDLWPEQSFHWDWVGHVDTQVDSSIGVFFWSSFTNKISIFEEENADGSSLRKRCVDEFPKEQANLS